MAKRGYLHLKHILYVWAPTSLIVQESAMGMITLSDCAFHGKGDLVHFTP